MSTTDHPMGARLALEARNLGPARTQGRLYDFGAYPGLIASSSGADQVEGELYELYHPDRSLPWLDAYEGLVPGGSVYRENEYARVEKEVVLSSGRCVQAAVYIYQFPTTQGRHLPEGRWQRPCRRAGIDPGADLRHDYAEGNPQGH